jgi:hypothetical protein
MIASALALSTTSTALAADQHATSLKHSRDVVAFFDNHHWLRAPAQPNCLAVPWTRSCRIARNLYTRHRQQIERLERLLFRTLPATGDWRTAVRITQRVFPGTESWLLYISNREGGWGPFVMNHEGSGAGGWMQFMSGTFYGYSDAARRAVASRGFVVDPDVFEWHDPLGQALTAGYMRFTGRDGCHWCL